MNALLNRAFDLLLRPLRPLPVGAGLAVVSFITAIAILIVVRLTSNQPALAAVKRQIHADLFEIRLFNDDLRAMLRTQLDMVHHNATYLRLSLGPILWTIVPLVLLIAQLQAHFGYTGATIAQPILVTAQLKSSADPQAELDAPSGIHADTPAIWFPDLHQVMWRVVADVPGDYLLGLRIGAETYEKTLHVSDGLARRSPVRPGPGLLDEVWYPSEVPLAESAPLTSITVAYPERYIEMFGWEMPLMVVYLAESIAFALLLKAPFRVTL